MALADLLRRPSVRDVLARATDSPVLTPEAEDAARAAIARLTSAQMPWYLRVLIGAGAWIGASFLLSAILSVILLASGEQMNGVAVTIGVIFILASIPFRRRAASPFATQLALVISSTGQILVIGGIGAQASSLVAGSIAAIVTSLVLIAWFPDRVQRFSATLVAFGGVAAIVIDGKIPHGIEAMALFTLALLLLWRFVPRADVDARAPLIEPVVYGVAITLIAILFGHSVIFLGEIFQMRWATLGSVTGVAFSAALLALSLAILIEQQVRWLAAIATVATIAIVALGTSTWPFPGVTATIFLLLLGFDRRARGLIVLAIVFFLFFGASFYYDLRVSLLVKSAMLASSGVICLLAAAGVRMLRQPGEAAR